MPKRNKPQPNVRMRTGNVTGSAIAVGAGAVASNQAGGQELAQAKALVEEVLRRLDEGADSLENEEEVRAELATVRDELGQQKPNVRLLAAALKGIRASLAPAQALANLVAEVLIIVRRMG